MLILQLQAIETFSKVRRDVGALLKDLTSIWISSFYSKSVFSQWFLIPTLSASAGWLLKGHGLGIKDGRMRRKASSWERTDDPNVFAASENTKALFYLEFR